MNEEEVPSAVKELFTYTDKLIQCGARNFLFMELAPVDRYPLGEHPSDYITNRVD